MMPTAYGFARPAGWFGCVTGLLRFWTYGPPGILGPPGGTACRLLRTHRTPIRNQSDYRAGIRTRAISHSKSDFSRVLTQRWMLLVDCQGYALPLEKSYEFGELERRERATNENPPLLGTGP